MKNTEITTNPATIPYTRADAIMDIDAAIATLEMMTLDGGIFSYSQEEAEKELGAAYIFSLYESIQTILFNMAAHLGRASLLLQHEEN